MNNYVAYAYDFVSYLLLQPEFSSISFRKILLFGSSVRGEATQESDIDIFIDADTSLVKQVTEVMRSMEGRFFSSSRMDKWKLLGIQSRFSVLVGDISQPKWHDLRTSMHSHAVVLYERFRDVPKGKLTPVSLFIWSVGVKDSSKRVVLARKLYGYSQRGKRYLGMLQKFKATSLGKGIALVASEHSNQLRDLFNTLKVKYTVRDFFNREQASILDLGGVLSPKEAEEIRNHVKEIRKTRAKRSKRTDKHFR